MTWEVGDLALCVFPGPWTNVYNRILPPEQPAPQSGGIYVVAQVSTSILGHQALGFEEFPGNHLPYVKWRATAFRKIPPHEMDDEDLETIRLLNSQPLELVP